ncbi:MAG: DUF2064 domain-containing protein [Salinivenus sp.]
MPDSRTVILFFSHRPEREWENKQFVPRDYGTHQRVAEALYEHSRHAVAESELPVLEVNGAQQRGDTFGARLSNAVAAAFARGYDHVIAVGSDCPRLHEVDWSAVDGRLTNGVSVLGPTPGREGAYLIGLTRDQFDREAFAALPWQSPRLFSALRAHLAQGTEDGPVLIASRGDVNGHTDLVALLRNSRGLPPTLLRRLRAALGAGSSTSRTSRPPTRPHVSGRRSRAPPPPRFVSEPVR